MPYAAYMRIMGTRQGPITAGTTSAPSIGRRLYKEGHEDEILVVGFDHTIFLPRDPFSGQPAGNRAHEPFAVTKVIDKSSALLMNALTTGELLKAEIRCYRNSQLGNEEHYYTISMDDAVITSINQFMSHFQDPQFKETTPMEKVSFIYRKITKVHEIACTSESDDWQTPRGG